MNYKTFLAALVACMVIGCGKSEEANTSAAGEATTANTATTTTKESGVAGTYSMSGPGGAMSLVLADDGTFTTTAPNGSGKGTYTKDGDKLTLTIMETDGKPASEKDKAQALVLMVSADGSSLKDQQGMMEFKKQ